MLLSFVELLLFFGNAALHHIYLFLYNLTVHTPILRIQKALFSICSIVNLLQALRAFNHLINSFLEQLLELPLHPVRVADLDHDWGEHLINAHRAQLAILSAAYHTFCSPIHCLEKFLFQRT